jgi:hypothetical protein
MATVGSITDPTGHAANTRLAPETYTTIDELIKTNKDFVVPGLVETYGDQGITGFLKLTGAINGAATNDQIEWWEAGRRHVTLTATIASGTNNSETLVITGTDESTSTNGADPSTIKHVQENDILLCSDTGFRYIVTNRLSNSDGDGVTIVRLDGAAFSSADAVSGGKFAVVGNLYAQGTDQPSRFVDSNIIKYRNPFGIVKGRYEVNGSQATNVGWIDLGGGEFRWFMYAEAEARRRFEDQREMTLLFGEIHKGNVLGETDNPVVDAGVTGTEGYFAAVEDRGLTITGGAFTAMSEIDDMIKQFDKQGAPAEYAMYLNRTQDLAIDDLLASGVATSVTAGLPGQFGAFNNDAEMAVKLGFKSFTRGGYTFHKHDWKLLNDPTLAGAATTPKFQGAVVPLSQVTDPRTGNRAPSLAMYYKAANGYSREMEHWVTGGGIMGFTNGDAGTDQMVYHYRSEVALCVRAANQHAVLKA